MTDKNDSKVNICIARAMLAEMKRIAWKRGVIELALYPTIAVVLTPPCNCSEPHPEETLVLFTSIFSDLVRFIDGLTITTEQARRALEHYFFGGGSLDDRRNHITGVIFDIETEDQTKSNYRKGWNVGPYRRTKEDQLLWPFAKMLSAMVYEIEQEAEAS